METNASPHQKQTKPTKAAANHPSPLLVNSPHRRSPSPPPFPPTFFETHLYYLLPPSSPQRIISLSPGRFLVFARSLLPPPRSTLPTDCSAYPSLLIPLSRPSRHLFIRPSPWVSTPLFGKVRQEHMLLQHSILFYLAFSFGYS